jgi:hypothetical protein
MGSDGEKCWRALQILTSRSRSNLQPASHKFQRGLGCEGVLGALLAPALLLCCLLLSQRLTGSLIAYLVLQS